MTVEQALLLTIGYAVTFGLVMVGIGIGVERWADAKRDQLER